MPHPRRLGETPGAEPLTAPATPTSDTPGDRNRALRRGLDLFNHGFFWEAHEAWEEPWQALPRESPRALHLQALIRLAAAALKRVMEEPAGVAAHAAWCASTFSRLQRSDPDLFDDGPAADALIALCHRLIEKREVLLPGSPQCLETILTLDVPE